MIARWKNPPIYSVLIKYVLTSADFVPGKLLLASAVCNPQKTTSCRSTCHLQEYVNIFFGISFYACGKAWMFDEKAHGSISQNNPGSALIPAVLVLIQLPLALVLTISETKVVPIKLTPSLEIPQSALSTSFTQKRFGRWTFPRLYFETKSSKSWPPPTSYQSSCDRRNVRNEIRTDQTDVIFWKT